MKNFSYSQALLALAITLLALSLFKIANEIPDMVAVIDKTAVTVDNITPQIPSIVATANQLDEKIAVIVEEVALVRRMVGRQIPNILKQVELTRPVVTQLLKESEQYSTQLPALFQHLDKIEQQVAQLQQLLPDILQRIDNIALMGKDVTEESAKWRPHSLQYIKQIARSETFIPQYLTRIENVVKEAKNMGKEASSGLVVGLLKGVVSLPFEMVVGLKGIVGSDSRSAKYLTDKDIRLIQEQTVKLLENTYQQNSAWKNSDSGNRGEMNKDASFEKHNQVCHTVVFTHYFKREKESLEKLFCRNEKGVWQLI